MSRRRTDASDSPSPEETSPQMIETTAEPAPDLTGTAGVLFQQPETPDPMGPPALTGDPTGEEGPPWSSGHGPESARDGDGGDSPRRSTGKSLRARARELAPVFAAAVATIGGIAHQLLTEEGSPEREAGLYVPDEEDQAAISEPLAGLASRRVPEGADNPDVLDLAQLAMGVVGYVVKQRDKAAQLARARFYAEDQADEQAAAGEPDPYVEYAVPTP